MVWQLDVTERKECLLGVRITVSTLDDVVGIISRTIKDLYRGSFPSWGKMPADLRRQMFLEFRKKCAWRPEHESQICANFHKKCHLAMSRLREFG